MHNPFRCEAIPFLTPPNAIDRRTTELSPTSLTVSRFYCHWKLETLIILTLNGHLSYTPFVRLAISMDSGVTESSLPADGQSPFCLGFPFE